MTTTHRYPSITRSRAGLQGLGWLVLVAALAACGDDDGSSVPDASSADTSPADTGTPDSARPDSGMVRPAGFDCVGSVTWPTATGPSIEATFRSFTRWAPSGPDGPFAGLEVALCAAGGDCESPLDTGTTDASGAVTLTMPTPGHGFAGYLHASAADHVSMRMEFFPPISTVDSRWLGADHYKAVLTGADIESIVADPGYTYDPARGVVVATIIDCAGEFDVFGEVDVSANGVAGAVHEAGDTVFVDVEPGDIEIVAVLGTTGEEIARIDSRVSAGEITAIHFGPMPD